MVLVVVRHARAEERSEFLGNDRERPLTEDGRERMFKNAKRLRELAPKLDVLISSPLLRAQQTTDVIKEVYEIKEHETIELLSPGFNHAELLKHLKEKEGETVCVVGHEPDLGEFCSWLLSGNSRSFIPIRKGGICILEFPGPILARNANLICKLDPRHL